MSRLLTLVVVFGLAIPATSFAQSANAPPRWTISPRNGPRSEGWPRDPVPRFTIPPRGTIGLPSIGLPLPPIGLQPPVIDGRSHGRRGHHGRLPYWPAVVYVVPDYLPPIAPSYEAEPIEPAVEQPVTTGHLILDAQPKSAQVFVDGYYAGVPDDFAAALGGGVLDAGPHRIDISAPGYESLSFDTKIAPGQSVTYRGTLKKIAPPAAPAAPSTFYLIPGCYMGNVPPKDAHLPSTCDLSRVIEFKY
jgi:hypothetical protein